MTWPFRPPSPWRERGTFPKLDFTHFKRHKRGNLQYGGNLQYDGTEWRGVSAHRSWQSIVKNPPTPTTSGYAQWLRTKVMSSITFPGFCVKPSSGPPRMDPGNGREDEGARLPPPAHPESPRLPGPLPRPRRPAPAQRHPPQFLAQGSRPRPHPPLAPRTRPSPGLETPADRRGSE